MCSLDVISCPIVCCHTAMWWEPRETLSRLFTGVFVCVSVSLAGCGFSHKLVSACLAATSEARSVSVCVCVCAVHL